MALQNITPQYQAEEKTAQLHLRPVPIHNGLYETGKMLTDAGQGLQKGAFSLTLGLKQRNDRLQAEEDELNLADKLNYVTSEATKYVAEYKKLGGMATEGGTKKYDAFMDDLLAKGQEGLPPRAARTFGQRFASLRLSLWNTVNGHEYSNVKSARIQGIQGQIENLAATFKLTRDPAVLQQIKESYNQLWEAQTGVKLPPSLTEDWGRRRNPETGEMDGDKKGPGWLGIYENEKGQAVTELSYEFEYNDKKYEVPALNPYTADYVNDIMDGNITPEIKERIRKWGEDRVAQGKSPLYNGDPEDESLRKVSDSQKVAEENMRLYQQGWQNISNKVLGGLFDEYSAEGNLEGMNAIYYNSEDVFGVELGDKEKVRMKQVVDNKFTEQLNEQMAQDYLLDVNVAGGDYAEGGRYNTPEQDAKFNEIINMLESTGNKDDKIVAERLKTLRRAQVALQESNFGAALAQNIGDLFHGDSVTEWEKDLWTLKSRINSMPYNLIRDTLEKFYQENAQKLDARYAATHTQIMKENAAMTEAEAKLNENNMKAATAAAKAHAASTAHKMTVARYEDEICAKTAKYNSYLTLGGGSGYYVTRFRYRDENGNIDQNGLMGWLNANAYELGGELLPEERERIWHLATDAVAVSNREMAIGRITNIMNQLVNKGLPDAKKTKLDPNTISLAFPDLVDYVIDIQREWSGAGEKKMDEISGRLNQAIIDYVNTTGNAGVLWEFVLGGKGNKGGLDWNTGKVNWLIYNEETFRNAGVTEPSAEAQVLKEAQESTKPVSMEAARDEIKRRIYSGGN